MENMPFKGSPIERNNTAEIVSPEAVADMISRARKMREGADKDSELAQKAMPTAVKTLRGVGREALVSASTR